MRLVHPTNVTNHVRGTRQVRVNVAGRKTVHALALARPLFAWQDPYVMPMDRQRAVYAPLDRLISAAASIVGHLLDACSVWSERRSAVKPAWRRSRHRVGRS